MTTWLSVLGTVMVLVGVVINLIVTKPYTKFITINGGTSEDAERWPPKKFEKIERRQQFLSKLAQALITIGTMMVLWGLILKK